MRHTYVCTVWGDRPSRAAVSFSELPSNTARTMPHSRGERPRQVASERHSPGTNTAWPVPVATVSLMAFQYAVHFVPTARPDRPRDRRPDRRARSHTLQARAWRHSPRAAYA